MPEKKKIKPLSRPGYTMFDNYVIDNFMPDLSASAWKVLCVALRQTIGWVNGETESGRKEKDRIAYSQFMKKTGIKSSTTLSKAIQENLEKGYLIREPSPGYKQMYDYRLNRDYEVEIETTTENGQVGEKPPQKMDRPNQKTCPENGHTKERDIKKEELKKAAEEEWDKHFAKKPRPKTETVKMVGDHLDVSAQCATSKEVNWADTAESGGASSLEDRLIAIFCMFMGEAKPEGSELVSARATLARVLKKKKLSQNGVVAEQGLRVLLDPEGEKAWWHDKYFIYGNKNRTGTFESHYGQALARLKGGGDGQGPQFKKSKRKGHDPGHKVRDKESADAIIAQIEQDEEERRARAM